MKIRAAVLEEFGRPLVVQDVDLAEPKAGEVLVRLAACGVCHTDLYTASGADPTGYAPCVLGHEGAGVVERVGEGVTLVRSRRPRHHAVRARVRRVRPLPQRPHEPLRRDPRPAGPRVPAGRHDAAVAERRGAAPLHGDVDVRGVHGDAGDRAREGQPRGAARRVRAVRVRAVDRDRCGALHRAGRARLDVRRLRLRPRRARRGDRRAARGRRADRRDRPAPRSGWRRHATTARRTCALAGDDTVDWIRSETGGFGADYTFEATGNVAVMRQAVEAAREAWGLATMCGVAGKGETLDVVPRFLITGRRVTGSSFGGVKGRTQVPLLVDRWLDGEIDVESLLSHRLTLDEVDRGFELMERQDGIRSVHQLRVTRPGAYAARGRRREVAPAVGGLLPARSCERTAGRCRRSRDAAPGARAISRPPGDRADRDRLGGAVESGHPRGGDLVPELGGQHRGWSCCFRHLPLARSRSVAREGVCTDGSIARADLGEIDAGGDCAAERRSPATRSGPARA